MTRRLFTAGLFAAAAVLAACGNIEESDPKPQLDAISTPGTAFGNTLIGTRKRLDFRLRNSDAGLPKVKPLQKIVPSISGTGLTLSHTCQSELKEGEECFLAVYYEPTAIGQISGGVSVASNAETKTLPLSGTAVAVLDPAAGAVAFQGSLTTDFGTVARNDRKTIVFVVKNIGNAADAITVTGPTGSGWSFSDDCPDTLAVGSSCNVSVTFAPTAAGNSVPTPLVIGDPYNAGYGGLSLPLTGTGS